MYRVELKDIYGKGIEAVGIDVPNVPCGVESSGTRTWKACLSVVPNVPCGVESSSTLPPKTQLNLFLMYRVELKASIEFKSHVFFERS